MQRVAMRQNWKNGRDCTFPQPGVSRVRRFAFRDEVKCREALVPCSKVHFCWFTEYNSLYSEIS
jgi:hypothetical protein